MRPSGRRIFVRGSCDGCPRDLYHRPSDASGIAPCDETVVLSRGGENCGPKRVTTRDGFPSAYPGCEALFHVKPRTCSPRTPTLRTCPNARSRVMVRAFFLQDHRSHHRALLTLDRGITDNGALSRLPPSLRGEIMTSSFETPRLGRTRAPPGARLSWDDVRDRFASSPEHVMGVRSVQAPTAGPVRAGRCAPSKLLDK